MKCQHTWIKANRAYEDYQCSQCEMGLSVDEYDAIQQAHRQGWEQGKAEASKIGHRCKSEDDCICGGLHFGSYERGVMDAINAIANMKYKEATNEG